MLLRRCTLFGYVPSIVWNTTSNKAFISPAHQQRSTRTQQGHSVKQQAPIPLSEREATACRTHTASRPSSGWALQYSKRLSFGSWLKTSARKQSQWTFKTHEATLAWRRRDDKMRQKFYLTRLLNPIWNTKIFIMVQMSQIWPIVLSQGISVNETPEFLGHCQPRSCFHNEHACDQAMCHVRQPLKRREAPNISIMLSFQFWIGEIAKVPESLILSINEPTNQTLVDFRAGHKSCCCELEWHVMRNQEFYQRKGGRWTCCTNQACNHNHFQCMLVVSVFGSRLDHLEYYA